MSSVPRGIIYKNSERSPSADIAIDTHAQKLQRRGVVAAEVRGTPDGQSWHTSGTDPTEPEHLTVDFKDDKGNHVTTHHVYRTE